MLTCKQSKFTLSPKVTYLNCAYMSPLLKAVEKAGVKGVRLKRNPAAIMPKDFFEDAELLRSEYAKLIRVLNPKQIVIIPSVSYGMATVAMNLKVNRGQKIIVASEQFPSNYYPWQRVSEEIGAELKVVAPPDVFINRGKLWNER